MSASLKRVLSPPLFYYQHWHEIGLYRAFLIFSPGTALRISIIVLLSIILFSLLIAIQLSDEQSVIKVEKNLNEEEKHNWALKILMNARKRVKNEEEFLKIDYEIGVVDRSMEQYQQAVKELSEILKNCDASGPGRFIFNWQKHCLI